MLAGGVYFGCAVKQRSVLAQLGTAVYLCVPQHRSLTSAHTEIWTKQSPVTDCLSGCKSEEWLSRKFNSWDLSLPKGKAWCPRTLTSNQS